MANRRKPHAVPACNFCRLTGDSVRLIAGPDGIYICNQCVTLCNEIIGEEGPQARPSKIQQATVILEDGTRELVIGGLRETAAALGRDDSQMVAFDLVDGRRIAVRREAVRQIHADAEPGEPPRQTPEWASIRFRPMPDKR